MKKTYQLLALTCILAIAFYSFGCDGGGDTYDLGSSSGISSARVFIPAGTGVTGATTVSGGFTNNKEDMYWLAERLQAGGVIAFAISASNNSSVSGYENAHRGGMALMASENTRSGSPINGRVGKRGVAGYSMGGGAVINLGDYSGVEAVMAMAPYSPDTPGSNHDAATMILTGTSDTIAPASMGENAFNRLPDSTPRLYASMSGESHLFWVNNSNPGSAADFMVAWAQYYLSGNTSAYSVFSQGPGRGMTDYEFYSGSSGSSSSSSSSSGGCN